MRLVSIFLSATASPAATLGTREGAGGRAINDPPGCGPNFRRACKRCRGGNIRPPGLTSTGTAIWFSVALVTALSVILPTCVNGDPGTRRLLRTGR